MLPAAFGPANDGDRRGPEQGESADEGQHRAVVALADRRSRQQRDQGMERPDHGRGDACDTAMALKFPNMMPMQKNVTIR